jgi:hypothetical protein
MGLVRKPLQGDFFRGLHIKITDALYVIGAHKQKELRLKITHLRK